MRAVILGGGSWGTSFATVLRGNGHDVTLACRTADQAAAIVATGQNEHYLPGISLTGIEISTIADAPVEEAQLVVVAVPSAAFADVVRDLPGTAPVLSLSKGLDPTSGDRLSTLVTGRQVAVLSGPNIADEIARGMPAASVLACESLPLAVQLQLAINTITFRVYASDDVTGVELCAAAKNVIALAAGGADGLGLGDNAKAALVARGLAEMARLVESAGARPETFSGLAGMGDLIVTCWSQAGSQSPLRRADSAGRNRRGSGRGLSVTSSRASQPRPSSASWRTGSSSSCPSPRACVPFSAAFRSAISWPC